MGREDTICTFIAGKELVIKLSMGQSSALFNKLSSSATQMQLLSADAVAWRFPYVILLAPALSCIASLPVGINGL